MQEKTFPYTFNSFDTKKGRVLIAPHGPDPVFYGAEGRPDHRRLYAHGVGTAGDGVFHSLAACVATDVGRDWLVRG